jgi:uncharacterized protein RhaS with RHS repeats
MNKATTRKKLLVTISGKFIIFAAVTSFAAVYYVHTDYQGSLTALSLQDGTIVERYAYDPWGEAAQSGQLVAR